MPPTIYNLTLMTQEAPLVAAEPPVEYFAMSEMFAADPRLQPLIDQVGGFIRSVSSEVGVPAKLEASPLETDDEVPGNLVMLNVQAGGETAIARLGSEVNARWVSFRSALPPEEDHLLDDIMFVFSPRI